MTMSATAGPCAEPRSFHILTKPIGPICNLNCSYCFYLEKEALYPQKQHHREFRMTDETLQSYVAQYIAHQDVQEIHFAWQGGEPTLMGLDFFRRVIHFQNLHCPSHKTVHNALQTNGLLLNDEWCEFLRAHDFLVGLSVDGPEHLHDIYRVDKAGLGTFAQVMQAWNLLKKHGVQYNTLTVVHRQNATHALEIYDFLKTNGSRYLQFIPLVERVGGPAGPEGFVAPALAGPPRLRVLQPAGEVTPWSVRPEDYGDFLIHIFDRWVRRDVGEVFVPLFETHLAIEAGLPSPMCVFSQTCGKALAMEHDGDVYSCDHFVYPEYKLGNIHKQTLPEIVDSPRQRQFGNDKRDALPDFCRSCDVLDHCGGECPKHRFLTTPDGQPGLNYLCAAYKKFFSHARPRLQLMVSLLRTGRNVADIMRIV